MARALLVVDVQNDFCEGGSLAVEGGAEVATRISEFIQANREHYRLVIASKDYHLPYGDNGGHFANTPDYAENWPAHCVQNTPGSEFHQNLNQNLLDAVVLKGQGVAAYSAFEGHTSAGRLLYPTLLDWAITDVDVVGIATDYCVKATAISAQTRDLSTVVIVDLTAAVGGEAGKAATAKELSDEGIWVRSSDNINLGGSGV